MLEVVWRFIVGMGMGSAALLVINGNMKQRLFGRKWPSRFYFDARVEILRQCGASFNNIDLPVL